MPLKVILSTWIVVAMVATAFGEQLYVDGVDGDDTNPGTKDRPVRTIARAAELVDDKNKTGSATIRIEPGIYTIEKTILFSKRKFSKEKRLLIEATVLPDDSGWKPGLMPVIVSAEIPKPTSSNAVTETYTLKIQTSHVTVRGLKFLGNPSTNNMHACIERVGKELDDLIVSQCMFVGDRNTLDIYCPVICTGNGMTVEHCIFYECHASVVFWDGLDGISGKNHAMRNCIVSDCFIAGPWTCQTDTNLEFSNNIVTRTKYFWMRKSGDKQTYKIKNSIVTENERYSGYGVESGAASQTGPEVTFIESGIVKDGHIKLDEDRDSHYYLHVVPGTFGSKLEAGLFKKGEM